MLRVKLPRGSAKARHRVISDKGDEAHPKRGGRRDGQRGGYRGGKRGGQRGGQRGGEVNVMVGVVVTWRYVDVMNCTMSIA